MWHWSQEKLSGFPKSTLINSILTCVTSLSLFAFMHWRRKWQPTSVFSPGESQGRGSLVGCCLWGRTESDTTEATWQQQQQQPVLHFASVWAFSHLFKCSPTVFPFYKLRLQHGLPEVTQLVANIAGNKVKHLDPSLALAASSEIHSAWVFSDKWTSGWICISISNRSISTSHFC